MQSGSSVSASHLAITSRGVGAERLTWQLRASDAAVAGRLSLVPLSLEDWRKDEIGFPAVRPAWHLPE